MFLGPHAKTYLGICSGLLASALALGCGDDDASNQTKPESCSTLEQSGCKAGLVCEEVSSGGSACFKPVSVKGRVFNTFDSLGIANARVVARDSNNVAISSVAISASDGTYELTVPVRRVDARGAYEHTQYTLRADAAGYLTFPRAPRVALPVEVSGATGDPPVVRSVATDIALISLENGPPVGAISGRVLSEHPGGTLVVAGAMTGIADRDGDYAIFNVSAGPARVDGYAAGVNLVGTQVEVKDGSTTPDVDLKVLGEATATVSGTVQIVNASGAANTSVILVVEDTFVAMAAHGEAPPGLRASEVSGAWSIASVPDGKYVVLAAFENDGLVRDPDTSIGGTDIQHINVAGASISVEGFKITGALAVESPGADTVETVQAPITFKWQDDSSEDEYTVQVFDALGELTWETTGNFDPGGSKPASVEYSGPALQSGMFYQFRATSIKDGVPISRTEDLRGVFVYE